MMSTVSRLMIAMISTVSWSNAHGLIEEGARKLLEKQELSTILLWRAFFRTYSTFTGPFTG